MKIWMMQLRFNFSFRYDAKRTQDLDNFFLDKKNESTIFFQETYCFFLSRIIL